MKLPEGLVSALEKAYRRMDTLGGLDTGFRHNTYYHKYFHGYTEIRKISKHGRVVVERRYTAPWHLHRLTTKQWVLVKIAYLLGALLSTALFLWALAQRALTNSAKLVAVPGFLAGFLMILLWAGICTYVSAPRKMTWWQHQSGKTKILRFSLLTAIAIGLTILMKVFFICVFLGFSWEGEIPALLALLFSAVPLLLIYLTERKMPYEEQENKTVVTEEERYQIW